MPQAAGGLRPGGPTREEPGSHARTPTGTAMLSAWRSGARLTASRMRAHFTDCGACPAAGAAAPNLPTVRRAHFTICRSAGALRPRGPPREEPESHAWTPTEGPNAVQPAPQSPAHGEPGAGAFHRAPRMNEMRLCCGAQLTGRNMRAHFTICPNRPVPPSTGTGEGGARRLGPAAHRDRKCCVAGVAAPTSGPRGESEQFPSTA
jgi:hypothetical protein